MIFAPRHHERLRTAVQHFAGLALVPDELRTSLDELVTRLDPTVLRPPVVDSLWRFGAAPVT
ncbi:hypothetical protein OG689_34385 [Kitasatospora sp. NBC_00240]|jgi:hypothetical protein|uniref:hypothetical protein n=1 Tax=Kitasatospora sp. NBC_00240 TaxID=2903567 RepID=UPI00225AE5A6|nr:hypothetical protein [Kitasatospora sp. NBC_00240]MCX5214296.1 hypothetical protein [Kitasatospora sp. NBC_00240]